MQQLFVAQKPYLFQIAVTAHCSSVNGYQHSKDEYVKQRHMKEQVKHMWNLHLSKLNMFKMQRLLFCIFLIHITTSQLPFM